MLVMPSSSGWRKTSRTWRRNSGSSSRKSTPLWASDTSPGRGTWPPPISPASEMVWWGARNGPVGDQRRAVAGKTVVRTPAPRQGREVNTAHGRGSVDDDGGWFGERLAAASFTRRSPCPPICGTGCASQPITVVRHPRRPRCHRIVRHELEPDGYAGAPIFN
jgi:hypothetical protein